ncbi:hypothetical protein [Streptomyces hesseae]|uniref:Uncharacterized protein n=1 Tax=Streptomyces hesseae TaxID=3075519 RepID=A0ABU2SYV0_9ACTN|nr:hypothetical protein [Streptomyces sp. DSM 40473]MDT0453766.1 hypothetical protein [Streptomyces sp. DSM 40473]
MTRPTWPGESPPTGSPKPMPAAPAEQAALRYGRGHLLGLGRVHTAFVAEALARSEGCGPLDLIPAPEHPTGPDGDVYQPAAELAYTANTDKRSAGIALQAMLPATR